MSEGRDQEYDKIGQYPLIKQLGKGGMGSVWYSEHPYLRIPCAIKILDAKLASKNPTFVERFIMEGKLAAAINHPNVVKVFDADYENDQFYLVLEYVDGCDVKKLAEDRGGKLPLDEVLTIAHSVGSALKEAYETHQIIHRDIKPENILVNSEGVLKLADLGIGKKISEEDEFNLTMTGMAMGTAYYISPEQAMDSKHIDHRSDMYSLGGTLFKLLTGEHVFKARTPAAMLMQHANMQPPDPQTLNPDLPDSICAVILKMLEKKPEKRYNNYDEFLADIDAIRLNDAPVESLTCFMDGITNSAPEPAAEPAKKKMHVSKKAQKHAEEMSHTVTGKSPLKKQTNSNYLTIGAIAVAALVILCGVIYMSGSSGEPEKEEIVKKQEIKKSEPEKRKVAASAFMVEDNSSDQPVNENKLTEKEIIANLEKALSESNNAKISVKDIKIDDSKVTALDLSNNINLKNLQALKGLPLVYLNLNNCQNLESLNGIQGSPLHELLMISAVPMKLNNLEALKKLPLKILKIANMPNLAYLDPLEELNLQELQLVECPRVKSLKPLASSKDLETLEISSSTPSELRDLRGLEGLPVKSLTIENCPQIRSLRPLVKCPLTEITIRDCQISSSELDLLYDVPLKKVDTGNRDFDDKYWAFIENGRSFPKPPQETNSTNALIESLTSNNETFSPAPRNETNVDNTTLYGSAKVTPIQDGELFIDGKKYADVKAGVALSIPKLKAGQISFSLKSKILNVESNWNIEPDQMKEIYLPNSQLAFNAKGFSSTLAQKYMQNRMDTKPAQFKDLQITVDTAVKWLIKNRNDDKTWGDDENRDGLTALATLALLSNRYNIFNENAEVIDRSIEYLMETVKMDHIRDMEEYPTIILALTEAYVMTKNSRMEKTLSDGLNNILRAQSQRGCFDPFNQQAEQHHLFYSPWVFEALKTAHLGGIYSKEVSRALNYGGKSIVNAYQRDTRSGPFFQYSFFDEGPPGFNEGGGPPGPGPGPGPRNEFGRNTQNEMPFEMMRANGTFSILASGTRSSKLTPCIQYMARKDLELINVRDSRVPMSMMNWYFATQAMYNYGGSYWEKWRNKMYSELISNADRGSWRPPSRDEVEFFDGNKEDARIYTTCMAILILNTEKRYLPYKSLP